MISLADAPGQFTGITRSPPTPWIKLAVAAEVSSAGAMKLILEDQSGLRELLKRATDRTQLTSDVRILDEEGTTVCRGYMVWKLRRR